MFYHPSLDDRDYSSIALSQPGKIVGFQYRRRYSRCMGDLPQYIHSYGILQPYAHELWGCNPRMGLSLTDACAWYGIAAFNAVQQIRLDLERKLVKHKMISNHVSEMASGAMATCQLCHVTPLSIAVYRHGRHLARLYSPHNVDVVSRDPAANAISGAVPSSCTDNIKSC